MYSPKSRREIVKYFHGFWFLNKAIPTYTVCIIWYIMDDILYMALMSCRCMNEFYDLVTFLNDDIISLVDDGFAVCESCKQFMASNAISLSHCYCISI